MKFLKYVICLLSLIILFNIPFVYANDENVPAINVIENDEVDKKQKENLKKEVSDIVEELRKKVNSIDEKINELKQTDEYNTYPTIRLNIDTPIFGIKSIVKQKLRITKEVAATDVAKGYSIRDIVKNRTVKLPEKKVGNIVVSTININIDDDLTINEYNTLILKLTNYIDKVDNVYTFLDEQTNKMFKEYISKEKKEKISELTTRLNKIEKDYTDKDNQLVKLKLINCEEYKGLVERYIKLNTRKIGLEIKTSNVLVESAKLNEIQKEVISLESDTIDFLSDIDKVYNEKIVELGINNVYLNTYNELKARIKGVDKYIKNSYKEVEIVNVENSEDKKEDKENKEKNDKVVATENIKNYDVFSKNYFDKMNELISKLEESMKTIDIKYINDEKIENDNKEQEEIKNENKKYEKLTQEEKDKEFENIINIYSEFLKNQYNFYLDNINGVLSLTNTKLNNLAEYTKTDIVSEVKYVYIELPKSLENTMEVYSTEYNVEVISLISNFAKELEKLNSTYLDILKIYNELNVDEIINKA